MLFGTVDETSFPDGRYAPSRLHTFGDLGDFGFSQFGGPGNTSGGPDPTSTDIGVIDVTNDDLTLLPEVTNWADEAVDADDCGCRPR